MAVSGDGFCLSCKSGGLLFIKHCNSFLLTKALSGFFVFLGKMMVVILNGLSVYIYLRFMTGDLETITALSGGPWIAMFVVTFIFVSLFLDIFNQIV